MSPHHLTLSMAASVVAGFAPDGQRMVRAGDSRAAPRAGSGPRPGSPVQAPRVPVAG
ncbi:hypothetical protein [Nocardioides guangzhouensis]|uniref:hypothetical protein n=1 Tax=Nocardioides guangzhouensis TaxID=2497878 RepID=UPI0014384BA2|nr:hypothetical protein [Nocardioides guangzhouensis]